MKKFKITFLCLMTLTFLITAISLPFFNDIIPMHFGIDGQPDQFGSKYFILIFPVFSLIVGVSMLLVAKYCNVTDNYRKYLFLTGTLVQIIFIVITITFVLYAFNYTDDAIAFDISKVIMPIFGILFIILGNIMPKVEKNRTLGMKTKWSMYNEVTWQKTHRFTGFVGVLVGVLCLILGLFFKDMVNFIILMSLLVVLMVSTTIASYIYYKEEKKKESQTQN